MVMTRGRLVRISFFFVKLDFNQFIRVHLAVFITLKQHIFSEICGLVCALFTSVQCLLAA